MRIEKTFAVAAPREDVWTFINDPNQVAACIPGCEDVEAVDEKTYRATVKLSAGPIKAAFKLNIAIGEQRPPEFATYHTTGEEGGKASRLSANSTLQLTPLDDDQCTVAYTSEITISGRLGKFGAGVMKKIADKEGARFAAALCAAIEKRA